MLALAYRLMVGVVISCTLLQVKYLATAVHWHGLPTHTVSQRVGCRLILLPPGETPVHLTTRLGAVEVMGMGSSQVPRGHRDLWLN